MRTKQGSILIGLLWCLALLSLIVVGVLHTARMDLLVVKNHGDRIQAHYLALAGIEKAKALLYTEARERSRTSRNHSGQLYDTPDQFREVKLGRGQFSILRRAKPDEGGGILYGVSDEESRLNINTAAQEELAKLDGMTPEVAAAIIDWRDSDNTITPGGAEIEYYSALRPPSQPRNGPLLTLRELLMVRGVSSNLLLGRDKKLNGMLGEGEEGWADIRDMGWAALLTVDSTDDNVNAAGQDRVDLQSADEAALTGVRGVTSDIAKAIVAHRGQNRFNSIADLLDVRAVQDQNQQTAQLVAQPNARASQPAPAPAPAPNPSPSSPAPGPDSTPNSPAPGQTPQAGTGPTVVSEDLLKDIADDLTAQSAKEQAGLVNINTASLEVLASLQGVDRELAQAIIAHRQSDGFFSNIAGLLKVPGLSRDLFKQLAPKLTARSETFRVISEGRVSSTGTRQRIQEIVHVGLQQVRTVSYREDDL